MSVKSASWQGALGGAGTGAAIGSSILPGIGTGVGALLGGIMGHAAGRRSGRELRDAQQGIEDIPLVDPNAMQITDQIKRERRAIQSGLTTEFSAGRQAVDEATAQGMSVAQTLYGQSPALALSMAQRLQTGAGQQMNQMLGIQGQRSTQYSQMLMEHLNRMSQRKLDISMHQAQQRLGVATQNRADMQQNMMAGMFMLPQFAGEIGQATRPLLGQLGEGIQKVFAGPSAVRPWDEQRAAGNKWAMGRISGL